MWSFNIQIHNFWAGWREDSYWDNTCIASSAWKFCVCAWMCTWREVWGTLCLSAVQKRVSGPLGMELTGSCEQYLLFSWVISPAVSPCLHSQTDIEITREEDFTRILQMEEEYIQQLCEDIIQLKPDVVITEKGISGKSPSASQACLLR